MSFRFQCVGETDEWYTPAHIFDALGCRFDLDVASPGRSVTPWIPADRFITDDSLATPWDGFVWMNPPFGARNGLVPWLAKFLGHGNGICLVPDRTSAPWWQNYASEMDMVLFVSPKIKFIKSEGSVGGTPAQGTTLLGIGPLAREPLLRAERSGLGRVFIPQ